MPTATLDVAKNTRVPSCNPTSGTAEAEMGTGPGALNPCKMRASEASQSTGHIMPKAIPAMLKGLDNPLDIGHVASRRQRFGN